MVPAAAFAAYIFSPTLLSASCFEAFQVSSAAIASAAAPSMSLRTVTRAVIHSYHYPSPCHPKSPASSLAGNFHAPSSLSLYVGVVIPASSARNRLDNVAAPSELAHGCLFLCCRHFRRWSAMQATKSERSPHATRCLTTTLLNFTSSN
jgi:hypothetical protein